MEANELAVQEEKKEAKPSRRRKQRKDRKASMMGEGIMGTPQGVEESENTSMNNDSKFERDAINTMMDQIK